MSFRPPGGGALGTGDRGADEGVFAAVGVFGVATVALVLVALLAAAGFVVLAQRRPRQLGMLGAIGATEKRLRLTMAANGAALGAGPIRGKPGRPRQRPETGAAFALGTCALLVAAEHQAKVRELLAEHGY
jgi:hypothetical protein